MFIFVFMARKGPKSEQQQFHMTRAINQIEDITQQ